MSAWDGRWQLRDRFGATWRIQLVGLGGSRDGAEIATSYLHSILFFAFSDAHSIEEGFSSFFGHPLAVLLEIYARYAQEFEKMLQLFRSEQIFVIPSLVDFGAALVPKPFRPPDLEDPPKHGAPAATASSGRTW